MILLINLKSISTSTRLDVGLLQWGTFLAIFGTVIPPICFTTGMPKIGAGLSAILLTMELPAAIFCAHIILGEQVTFLQAIGVLIMLCTIIYLNLAKAKNKKKAETYSKQPDPTTLA
jgi:drug/metabolite transporter (DMT)-like permease